MMLRWFRWLLGIGLWMGGTCGLGVVWSATSRPTTRPAHVDYGAFLQARVRQLAVRYRRILLDIQHHHRSIVREWIQLAEIPAPSRQEYRRATYFAQRMRALGLQTRRDRIGNVIAVYPGVSAGPRRTIVLMAHLDTVFSAKVDHRVRWQGHRLYGPGIMDNTVGLINLLVIAKILQTYKIRLRHNVWLVGTVQEEIGLRGAKALFARHHKHIDLAIALDGGYGGISYGGVGIHWYRIEYHDQARHTLSSMGQPSTTLAVARAIRRIYQLRVPNKPPLQQTWYNVGKIGGGHVVNAQSERSWFTVDLRSMNAAQLQRLEQQVFRISREVAQQSKVRLNIVTLHKTAPIQLAGMPKHLLVLGATAVLRHLGVSRVHTSPFGANDHCAALVYGIPGINIGTTHGAHIHSLQEWADVRYVSQGIQQTFLLLMLILQRDFGGSH